jgi:hypothetical protein
MPLISGLHLAFQSADHVNEMADADLEKVGPWSRGAMCDADLFLGR